MKKCYICNIEIPEDRDVCDRCINQVLNSKSLDVPVIADFPKSVIKHPRQQLNQMEDINND